MEEIKESGRDPVRGSHTNGHFLAPTTTRPPYATSFSIFARCQLAGRGPQYGVERLQAPPKKFDLTNSLQSLAAWLVGASNLLKALLLPPQLGSHIEALPNTMCMRARADLQNVLQNPCRLGDFG